MTKDNNNKNNKKNPIKKNSKNKDIENIPPKKKIIIVISRKNDDENDNLNKNDDKNDDDNKNNDNKNNDYDDNLNKNNDYDDENDNLNKNNDYDDFYDDYYDDYYDNENNSKEENTDEYTEEDYNREQKINDEIDEENEKNKRKHKLNKNNKSDDPFANEIDFNNIFTIMGILGRPPNDDNNDEQLLSKKKRKKDKSTDNFLDYFNNSSELKPINQEIKTLDDLIKLGETYNPLDKNKYVINMKALHKCVGALKDLNSMIGMKNIKEMIVDLIFFRLQNFNDNKEELWHLVIQGSPGCGKTEVSKIIGKLYYNLGIVKKDKFIQVKRSDLIGKYLGHTAKQTQQIFDDAEGGVLFIDEAYSLGNPEGKDSFSKECIDTINLNLTEKKNTAVFIAGYKDQLNESFFSYNPGLNRRFKMRLNVDKYDASELQKIFLKKLRENNWEIMDNNIEKNIPLLFFEKNISSFKYNGGDIENLWHLTKIVHARRVFGKSNDFVKKISIDDLNNALKMYSENDEFKERNENNDLKKYLQNTMYC